MNMKKRFGKICKDIKEIKIQGAEAVAVAGLHAYDIFPSKDSRKKLLSLRPTEPALKNALDYAEKFSVAKALEHFKKSEKIMNNLILRIVKNNSIIFTHCHSSTVIDGLVYSKKKGRKFSVLNTETEPLHQGRKTAMQLSNAGIRVTTFADSAARIAIKKADIVLIGADAILKDGSVINKIGSGMFAQIAHDLKKPVYIAADSWKFSPVPVKIEERNYKEIWKNAPKKVKVKNPAFEKIEARFITRIISELGILKIKDFVKKIK